jgi:hypothetical protein
MRELTISLDPETEMLPSSERRTMILAVRDRKARRGATIRMQRSDFRELVGLLVAADANPGFKGVSCRVRADLEVVT